jgi:hypothetical protein
VQKQVPENPEYVFEARKMLRKFLKIPGKFPEIDLDMNNQNKYLELMKKILEPYNK